jgi:hypothetical protein
MNTLLPVCFFFLFPRVFILSPVGIPDIPPILQIQELIEQGWKQFANAIFLVSISFFLLFLETLILQVGLPSDPS